MAASAAATTRTRPIRRGRRAPPPDAMAVLMCGPPSLRSSSPSGAEPGRGTSSRRGVVLVDAVAQLVVRGLVELRRERRALRQPPGARCRSRRRPGSGRSGNADFCGVGVEPQHLGRHSTFSACSRPGCRSGRWWRGPHAHPGRGRGRRWSAPSRPGTGPGSAGRAPGRAPTGPPGALVRSSLGGSR